MLDYNYYVYGQTIARVETHTHHMEVKQHTTDQWVAITDPQQRMRIGTDGDAVSEKEAEKMYQIFHARIMERPY